MSIRGTRGIAWLSGLLVVQLVIAAGLYFADAAGPSAAPEALLEFDADMIDEVRVDDGDQSARIVRAGATWQLPELDGLPASKVRVNDLLEKLASLDAGWPVATTESAASRFEVDDDNYQKKLELHTRDGVQATLLLGTSPGFRKIHARNPASDAVHAVELNSFDVPARSADWLDKSLLSVSDPTALRGPGIESEREAELAAAFENLRVIDIAQDRSAPDGSARYTLTTPDGEFDFDFWQEDELYLVRRSDIDAVFQISQLSYDGIVSANQDPQRKNP